MAWQIKKVIIHYVRRQQPAALVRQGSFHMARLIATDGCSAFRFGNSPAPLCICNLVCRIKMCAILTKYRLLITNLVTANTAPGCYPIYYSNAWPADLLLTYERCCYGTVCV